MKDSEYSVYLEMSQTKIISAMQLSFLFSRSLDYRISNYYQHIRYNSYL